MRPRPSSSATPARSTAQDRGKRLPRAPPLGEAAPRGRTDPTVIEEAAPAVQSRADEFFRLDDALGSMAPRQRRALLLREWKGLSYREIAQELRLSPSGNPALSGTAIAGPQPPGRVARAVAQVAGRRVGGAQGRSGRGRGGGERIARRKRAGPVAGAPCGAGARDQGPGADGGRVIASRQGGRRARQRGADEESARIDQIRPNARAFARPAARHAAGPLACRSGAGGARPCSASGRPERAVFAGDFGIAAPNAAAGLASGADPLDAAGGASAAARAPEPPAAAAGSQLPAAPELPALPQLP